jgi:hypothetical protein
LRPRLRLAQRGDVVIAATSEDLDGLGKATVWLGSDDVAVHDDCYIFRHSLDPLFASFLFLSPWFHDQKRKYASGTKVTRISAGDLANIEVPIPSDAAQARIGEALRCLSVLSKSSGDELIAAKRLRGTVLGALLSQQVQVPESYDARFVGAA